MLSVDNVLDMDGMFYLCKKLENLDLTCVKSTDKISMKDMFYGCKYDLKIKISDIKLLDKAF